MLGQLPVCAPERLSDGPHSVGQIPQNAAGFQAQAKELVAPVTGGVWCSTFPSHGKNSITLQLLEAAEDLGRGREGERD
jgi:hypothetical protein